MNNCDHCVQSYSLISEYVRISSLRRFNVVVSLVNKLIFHTSLLFLLNVIQISS